MNRLFSLLTATILFFTQLSPFVIHAQTTTELKDFKITVESEVDINQGFDMTVTAVDAAGKKLDKYEGTIFFDTNNNTADVVLPFEDGEYKFTLSDQGEHTFQKGFTLKSQVNMSSLYSNLTDRVVVSKKL